MKLNAQKDVAPQFKSGDLKTICQKRRVVAASSEFTSRLPSVAVTLRLRSLSAMKFPQRS